MIIVWLTGRPCSGKTTLGQIVVQRLNNLGWRAQLLDGDEIRKELWPELGFTKDARELNIYRFTYLAQMLADQDVVPVVSVVSPYRSHREMARRCCAHFVEVYVNASLETCIQRDVKGMYRKAMAGKIPLFTGINDPYEPPDNPDVECITDIETVDTSVAKIMNRIDEAYNVMYSARFQRRG